MEIILVYHLQIACSIICCAQCEYATYLVRVLGAGIGRFRERPKVDDFCYEMSTPPTDLMMRRNMREAGHIACISLWLSLFSPWC